MSLRLTRFPFLTEWSYGLRRQQGTKRNVRIAEASRVDFGPPVNRLPYRSHVTAVVHEHTSDIRSLRRRRTEKRFSSRLPLTTTPPYDAGTPRI
jgi:hypothetical protein